LGRHGYAGITDGVDPGAGVVENVEVLAFVQEDAEGLVRKVAVLEVELVEAHRAWEVAEEKFRSLSDASADGVRWLVVSKMEHREQFEQFSLLRA
jgi:hypothetical protein